MTEFLARVGDRINPIVVKETRQAVSSRLVAAFLLLFLGIQLLVMLLLIQNGEMANPDDTNLRAGREVFTIVQGILLGTCMVLIPTMTGARLGGERSDVNVDLLFISSLTPRAVLAGKLFAGAALALLIFSACAPFMTFAYVMRGLDVPTILVVLAADFTAVLLATTVGLFLAAVPANRGLRIFIGVGGFVFICVLSGRLLTLSAELLRGDAELDPGTWDFWAAFAGLAGLAFGLMGLLFVWAVALISPAAANRAYPVRVYTLAFWAATAVGFALLSAYDDTPEPVGIWATLACVLFSLQMIVATCERDAWGARVARRIPRRLVPRVLAFFFYSGAAGGFAFGAIGAAVSTLGVHLWYHAAMPSRFTTRHEPVLLVGLVAGYVYCYCLTATVVRRVLAGTTFRSEYTWVLAALLFGLGCTIPYIARFALFDNSPRYAYSDELLALYLTNPAVMIPDVLESSASSHRGLTLLFLVVWGTVATAANVPWFVKQATTFRPPDPAAEKPRAFPRPPLVDSANGVAG
jgi:ABC-type transport system involved in multi-copper enzyme maturation permease subunit